MAATISFGVLSRVRQELVDELGAQAALTTIHTALSRAVHGADLLYELHEGALYETDFRGEWVVPEGGVFAEPGPPTVRVVDDANKVKAWERHAKHGDLTWRDWERLESHDLYVPHGGGVINSGSEVDLPLVGTISLVSMTRQWRISREGAKSFDSPHVARAFNAAFRHRFPFVVHP